ncbi:MULTISPECIES: MSMEG_1061 family FMN-dependent PPOX-type flavoprotein [Streptomyces]|uniref:Pyridoxamine 5'-phosphate oxidase family protein n=1 Tax=Streptomyces glycanivorans TaxID=3033808 RepID=A0ABY9JAY7_9ACTN|nr:MULTISPECIES: MSMEG_1061 family FMN-dependent PPOX-type flavoprotein [unclassified Streptomyces]WSQ77391.1 pyridoxamine 5'-phosphate oxidase family protein [Streptomyces sp. NBC_01213]TXS18224.1 pyridoxamine 5'-phosphate oxidase family protein [Streptomyces sp. wa22]WLQ63999.1 pyridoxamine 5'-phosphate oxidase family protein [Streptomyces sp. Alt3]WSQ84721.1 pyridoxamine 5'-phosphate oxidase family protein [Streptomyces sp. NBC_01212]WSR09165.1 pyridoxamine 5'-phosphate oxidase family prote
MTHAPTRPRRVSPEEVSARLGQPEAMVRAKVKDRIDDYFRHFIAHSPFLTMATADAAGRADCSPRGDYPGFVKVLDDRTLALPDRPGNKIADSFRNLAENDGVGLCLLVPGVREVLRVNGSGYVTDEPDVLARMRTEARQPELAIVVEVSEAYFHCGRALIRSRLWDPASQALAEGMPSLGEIAAAQFGVDVEPGLLEQALEDGYRKLY